MSDYNTPINTIVSEFNGNLDNNNIKASAGIDGSKIADASIPAAKLATGAITLGYAQITSTFSSASASPVQVTGLSTTVTIPTGGRRVKITVFARDQFNNTNGQYCSLTIWDGTVGSGTILATNLVQFPTAAPAPAIVMAVHTPSAGSKTYNVGISSPGSSGTASLEAAAAAPAFILVEAI